MGLWDTLKEVGKWVVDKVVLVRDIIAGKFIWDIIRNMPTYRFNENDMDSTLKYQKFLNDLINANLSKVEKIESNMANDCKDAFLKLLDSIEKTAPHYTNQIIYLQNIADSIPSTIKGQLKSNITKKLSLSNEECVDILKRAPGDEKIQALFEYYCKVSKENIQQLQTNVTTAFHNNIDNIKNRFNTDINEKEKELKKANAELESIKNADNLEKFKKQLDLAENVFIKSHFLLALNRI